MGPSATLQRESENPQKQIVSSVSALLINMADEITQLKAQLAAVTAERDAVCI